MVDKCPVQSQNEYKGNQQLLVTLEENNKERYGLKTRICLQSVDELNKFEEDLTLMIKNIDFRYVNNKFQKKLRHNTTEIRSSNKVIVPADKTRNLQKIEKEDYNKFLSENITKAYKKPNRNKVNKLNFDAKKIADKLSISDIIDRLQKNKAYITAKDHKENFQNSPTFRLINPTKTNIGKISKTILNKIIKKLMSSIQVKQWKNSSAVIKRFKSIQSKNNYSLIVFNIENVLSIYFLNFVQQYHPICERNL